MQQFFNLSLTHKNTLFTSENQNRGERDEKLCNARDENEEISAQMNGNSRPTNNI